MKNLIVILLLGLFVSVNAQTEYFETDIRGIRTDIREVAKEIVAENLELTTEQAKIFWPLYDEYMAERNPIFDEKVSVTEEYMMNYYALDDETAKDLIKKAMGLNQALLDARMKSLDKMFEQLPATLVGKFFQIDSRISALIDMVRMSSTPLVRDEE